MRSADATPWARTAGHLRRRAAIRGRHADSPRPGHRLFRSSRSGSSAPPNSRRSGCLRTAGRLALFVFLPVLSGSSNPIRDRHVARVRRCGSGTWISGRGSSGTASALPESMDRGHRFPPPAWLRSHPTRWVRSPCPSGRLAPTPRPPACRRPRNAPARRTRRRGSPYRHGAGSGPARVGIRRVPRSPGNVGRNLVAIAGVDIDAERLLAQHRQAGLDTGDREIRMGGAGGGNHHDVDGRVVNEREGVTEGGWRRRTPRRPHRREPGLHPRPRPLRPRRFGAPGCERGGPPIRPRPMTPTARVLPTMGPSTTLDTAGAAANRSRCRRRG